MYMLEEFVQDVAPGLPTAVGTVGDPMAVEGAVVSEWEIKGDSNPLQQESARSQDEAYSVFVRPLCAVSAISLELIMRQPQQRDSNFHIGALCVTTCA